VAPIGVQVAFEIDAGFGQLRERVAPGEDIVPELAAHVWVALREPTHRTLEGDALLGARQERAAQQVPQQFVEDHLKPVAPGPVGVTPLVGAREPLSPGLQCRRRHDEQVAVRHVEGERGTDLVVRRWPTAIVDHDDPTGVRPG